MRCGSTGGPSVVQPHKEGEMVSSRRSGESGPSAAITGARKLAWLWTGLLVALFVFGFVPAAQSSILPAAQSGLKVQDRSHDNDNPDNTLYALYQVINTGTSAVPLSSVTLRYWF